MGPGRKVTCMDSTKHVPETSAFLPISPGAVPVGVLVRGKEARQQSHDNRPPLWRHYVLRPSVEEVSPGTTPAESCGEASTLQNTGSHPWRLRYVKPSVSPLSALEAQTETRSPTLQADGSPLWRLRYVKPSVNPSPALEASRGRTKGRNAPGVLPVDSNALGRSVRGAGSVNSADAQTPTQSKSPRPLLTRSRRYLPARCRRGTTPKARARFPRTQFWTTLSGAAPVADALSGKCSVTAQLSRRVATCQPRTRPLLGASLRGYSVSGIPGSYRSRGIHKPSSRLCCPGGSFERSQSAGCVFVPRPNTARPEGGCLTIHQSSSHPLPSWLKYYC